MFQIIWDSRPATSAFFYVLHVIIETTDCDGVMLNSTMDIFLFKVHLPPKHGTSDLLRALCLGLIDMGCKASDKHG